MHHTARFDACRLSKTLHHPIICKHKTLPDGTSTTQAVPGFLLCSVRAVQTHKVGSEAPLQDPEHALNFEQRAQNPERAAQFPERAALK